MRENGLHALYGYRIRHIPAPKPHVLIPNLLQRQFRVSRPNGAWVTVSKLATNSFYGYLLPGLVPGGPNRKRGHSIGKTWGRRIRSLGITDRRLVFHALRATFITAALNDGAPKEVVQQIAGHERGGVTMTTYVRVLSLYLCRTAEKGVSLGATDDFCRHHPTIPT